MLEWIGWDKLLSIRTRLIEFDFLFLVSAVILPCTSAPFTASFLPVKSIATMGPLSPDFPEWMWACVTLLRPSASIWYQILVLALFTMNPEIPVADTSGWDGTSFFPLSIAMYPFAVVRLLGLWILPQLSLRILRLQSMLCKLILSLFKKRQYYLLITMSHLRKKRGFKVFIKTII